MSLPYSLLSRFLDECVNNPKNEVGAVLYGNIEVEESIFSEYLKLYVSDSKIVKGDAQGISIEPIKDLFTESTVGFLHSHLTDFRFLTPKDEEIGKKYGFKANGITFFDSKDNIAYTSFWYPGFSYPFEVSLLGYKWGNMEIISTYPEQLVRMKRENEKWKRLTL